MLESQTSLISGTTKGVSRFPLTIAAVIVLLYYSVFSLFQDYDWEHPLIKMACFMTLFCMIIVLTRLKEFPTRSNTSYITESIIVSLALLVAFGWRAIIYWNSIHDPAACDIGFMTHDSLKLLIFDHQDPYTSTKINMLGENPKFWGYKYGPTMLLFYLPSAWFTSAAIKIITLIYLALTLFVIAYLIAKHQERRGFLPLTSSFLFALLLFFIPERLWFEIMYQGSTDILMILLILLSVCAIDKGKYLGAGILAGITFSAKFGPAILFILLMVRKKPSLKFFGGVLIGSLPLLAWIAWSGMSVINNVFIFQIIKKFDSTSLYWVTPHSFHFIFHLIQASAVASFLIYNYKRPINTRSLLVHFTLLLTIIESTHQEVHANHLIWFIPLLALLFTLLRNSDATRQEKSAA